MRWTDAEDDDFQRYNLEQMDEPFDDGISSCYRVENVKTKEVDSIHLEEEDAVARQKELNPGEVGNWRVVLLLL